MGINFRVDLIFANWPNSRKLNPAISKNSHSQNVENLDKKVYNCQNNASQRSEFEKINSREMTKIAIREN